MVTHERRLEDIAEAYDLFANQRDSVLKIAITPRPGVRAPPGGCAVRPNPARARKQARVSGLGSGTPPRRPEARSAG